MAELELIDLIIAVLPVFLIILTGGFLGGLYKAKKKLIHDLGIVLEDDKITKEELILLIEDALGIITILKQLFKR